MSALTWIYNDGNGENYYSGGASPGEVAVTFNIPNPSTFSYWIDFSPYRFTVTSSSVGIQGIGGASANVHNGSTIRAVVAPNFTVGIYVDNTLLLSGAGSGFGNGSIGIGSYSSPADGNGVSWSGFGPPDGSAPTPVPQSSIGVSAFTSHVDIQWPQTSDDANGTGVYEYQIYRGGQWLANVLATQSLWWSDTTVVPSTIYNYTLAAVDYHFNSSSTNFTVQTPAILTNPPYPSATPEGRQVGVRPTGTYWGAGGENIDVRSGNLNFTLPLLKAQGRGGWGVTFNLLYNSQNWRQDSGGTWQFDADVGYGFGWRLMAGAIIPVWNPGGMTAAYFLFVDSTGAEYRLDQNDSNRWSSKQSVYVTFDANTNILHFRDGSFWVFACVSSETADSGVLYPTLMEDPNGNQVLVRYNQGTNATWANSSARIAQIEDVRAVLQSGAYYTYAFNYSGTTPHLSSITNTIGTGEGYNFTLLDNQTIYSPFNGQSFGTTKMLYQVTVSGIGTYHQFTFNSSGELTKVQLPYKGYLAYDYITTTYSSGRSYREVQHRYLSKDGVTQTTYPFSHEPSPGPDVHSHTVLDDPGGVGEKYWAFATSGSFEGLTTQYQGRQLPGPLTLTQNDFTRTQDAVGNSYISSTLTTADPGQSYQAQKQTNQTVDTHGNVTQVVYYNWNSLTTPMRTDNFAYLSTNGYTTRYIYNRLTSSPTTTIQYDYGTPSSLSGLREWDSSVQGVTARGNPTTISGPAGTTTVTYNVAGGPTSTTVSGVTATVTTTSATNCAAPSQLTVGVLSESMSYNSFLGLTNETGPNGVNVSLGYDLYARPTSTTSPFGAVTTYSYNDTSTPPNTATAVNGRWTQNNLDGLGRTVLALAGYGTTTVSQAETVYDSCGCSPLGKMVKQAMPHSGGTPAYTVYTYDGIGRTKSVLAPDGASTTTYLYQGNTVTVTDPAGKWKKFTTDALGNLVQVNEPNPGGGSGGGGPWYNSSWTRRKQITIDHTKVSGGANLASFPVLISLASDANLAAAAQSSGNDILFTASDAVTKLNHQIEQYTSSSGQLIAWVQIPTLSYTADTVVYMYYGNASASNQQNAAGVWDGNFKGVWHLGNGTTLSLNDSTANGNNGTNHGAVATTIAKIGTGSAAFNGSTYVTGSGVASLANSAYSVSYWLYVNTTANHGYQAVFSAGSVYGVTDGNIFSGINDYFVTTKLSQWTEETYCNYGSSIYQAWTHFTFTLDSSKHFAIYMNGSLRCSGALTGLYNGNGDWAMGTLASQDGPFDLYGNVQEVHASNTARSAGWIGTEYSNQNSPGSFYSVGAEQSSGGGGGGSQPITVYGTGVTGSGLAADGSTDTHYTLVSSADPSYPGPATKAVTSTGYPFPYWIADGPNSKWIAPRADTGTANYNSPGTYIYRTTFDLTGLNPATAVLTGSGAADDSGYMNLNGATVASFAGYSSATPFTITTGFVAGINTLDFVVTNGGQNPTGLRVDISGTASPSGSGGGDYVTTYGYDILGHVTGVSMTRSTGTQTRSFVYSGNYLVSATNPENGTVNYSYNSFMKVASRTDAKNQQVVYSYDNYARLTKVQRYPVANGAEDLCQQENYTYGTASDQTYTLGRLQTVQYKGGYNSLVSPTCDTTFTESYTYTQPGGVATKTLATSRTFTNSSGGQSNQSVNLVASFTYDNEGRMLTEQYPNANKTTAGPNLSFTYDSMGRAYSVTDVGNNQTVVANASYGPSSELLSMGGGTWGTETRAYNSLLQLTSLTNGGVNKTYHYPGASNNGKIDYEYDALSGEQVNYTYDSLNRLATAVSNSTSAPWGQSFGYDGFGNLTNVNVISGSAPTLATSYDPTTNHGTCSDANGNTEGNANCAGYNALPYDIENRLGASSVNSGATHYSYAPGNKRVWKGVGSNTSQYNPAITDELTFWSPAGQKLATYQLTEDYYGTQISAWQQTGTYYYFGSKLIKNAAGFVYADRLGSVGKYYPYGQDRGSGNPASGEKFTGYFRDSESGLDYADQRYESPGVGRFLTPDPSGAASARPVNPATWNRYAYVTNDPVNKNDPTGLDEGPPESTCFAYGVWWPSAYCDVARGFQGPSAQVSPLSRALGRLSAAVDAIEDRSSVSVNCQKDLDALSAAAGKTIDLASIQDALADTDFQNGVTSKLPVSALYGPGAEAAGAAFQRQEDAKYGPGQTIGNEFGRNLTGLTADTVLLGNTIFINPALIGGNLIVNESLLFHEALHELGLVDSTIQSALGLTIDDKNTKNITTKLEKDCVTGKGNN